jgi:sulfite reductase (NADPH) flavoprotein alpha-component
MSPHAINDTTSAASVASATSAHSNSPSVAAVISSPFGAAVDPNSISSTSYTSPYTLINQTIYAVSSKIFSYDTAGADSILDAHVQFWSNHGRSNSFGVVPYFHKLQVRSGASSAILGYFSKNGTAGQPLSVLAGAASLPYMLPTLSKASSATLPLSFHVTAMDFDADTSSLVSNYTTPLSVARSLGYPVITPVSLSGLELQHLTLFSHYLVSLTGQPAMSLFDGPEFAATYQKFDQLLSVDQLGDLYQKLLSEGVSNTNDLGNVIDSALSSLNKLTGQHYSQFEYSGHAEPLTVFVVYGSYESSQLDAVVAASDQKVGLIRVRIPLPFNQNKFVASIPKSTKKLVVLSQENAGVVSSLKADVTAALFLGGRYHELSLEGFNYPMNFVWTPITIVKIFMKFIEGFVPEKVLELSRAVPDNEPVSALTSPDGKYLFWGKDNGPLVQNSTKLAHALSLDNTKSISIRNKFDNSVGGGLFQSQIISGTGAPTAVDSADVVIVDDISVLESYDILATAKPGATILLVNTKPIKPEEDFITRLSRDFRSALLRNHNKLTVIDLPVLEDLEVNTEGFSVNFLIQLAFWRATLPALGGFVVNKLLQANGNEFELLGAVLDKFVTVVEEKGALKEIDVTEEKEVIEEEKKVGSEETETKADEAEVEDETEEVVPPPFFPLETSLFPNPRNTPTDEEPPYQSTYKSLATRLTFPEAYDLTPSLRPDLPVKNFVVKVQENKRLTPSEYSRNIFHIEFDTTGTGLKYEIGEALGIHGRNLQDSVDEFLKFYGVDGDSVVEVSSRDDNNVIEIRSARQVLTDSIDFQGKPPKRFYESLATFASGKDKEVLENLASAGGSADLKQRQDVAFDTYVDILEEFTSARPSFAELVAIIDPLKRREYSIASSQKMHNNSVHLLIVVVDWVDSRGRIRYGHCSKFLSDLSVGDELVVSVKPSVMKLPPLSTQPIVMSGLGTGLAPFKAFIEEKIWQQQQGMEIGEVYLYMGSRHKKEEYLYGELWEAYKDAGVLTHIGAAFSRDQPQKIYIQDKIRESIEDLTEAIVAKNGSFYLCGPTWPVPDITGCLEDILKNGAKREGREVKDMAREIEELKEGGRYVLEVY